MIKISDIVNKEFSRSFMGYDMREVDYFLDEIIEQLETYERERQEMLTAMEYLLRELEQFDDIADDAEKQLRHPETPQTAAVPPENRTRRAVRVNPVAASANPDEQTAPAADAEAEMAIVLEELEIDEESVWTAEPDDAAVDAPAEPEIKMGGSASVAPVAMERGMEAPAAPVAIERDMEAPAAPDAIELDAEAPAAPDAIERGMEAPAAPDAIERDMEASVAPDAIELDMEAPTALDTIERDMEASVTLGTIERGMEASAAPDAIERDMEASVAPDAIERDMEAPAAPERLQAADDPTGKESN